MAEAANQVLIQKTQREDLRVLDHLLDAHDPRQVRLVRVVAQDGLVSSDFIG
jgi:hypothetical protein